jgi:hypothetical protein
MRKRQPKHETLDGLWFRFLIAAVLICAAVVGICLVHGRRLAAAVVVTLFIISLLSRGNGRRMFQWQLAQIWLDVASKLDGLPPTPDRTNAKNRFSRFTRTQLHGGGLFVRTGVAAVGLGLISGARGTGSIEAAFVISLQNELRCR